MTSRHRYNNTIDAPCIPNDVLTLWTRDGAVVVNNLTHLFTIQTKTCFTSTLTVTSHEFGNNEKTDEGDQGGATGQHGSHGAIITSDHLGNVESGGIAVTNFFPLLVAGDGCVLSTICEHGSRKERKVIVLQRGK